MDKLGILNSELNNDVKIISPQKQTVANFRNLESHAIKEQLRTFHGVGMYFPPYKKVIALDNIACFFRTVWILLKYFFWAHLTKNSQEEKKELSNLCVIPLPHFNSYSYFPEDRHEVITDGNSIIPYKEESAFVRVASNQNSNNIFRQGDTVLEVMLEYKWKTFARWKFIQIYMIHILYYISYATGVLYSRVLYVDEEGGFDIKHPGHITSLVIMGISFAVLLVQEFRQFGKTNSKMDYISSGYNWVDLAAFTFPVFTMLQSLLGWDYFASRA